MPLVDIPKQPAFAVGYKDRIKGLPRSKNPFVWVRLKSAGNVKKIYWDNGWDKADIELNGS